MESIIKKRNLFIGFLLTIITFGIYIIYWFVQTKKEMIKLGGEIPSSFLIIIPFANIYWTFKYCDAFAKKIKNEDSGLIYFLLSIVFFPIFPIIIQSALNNYTKSGNISNNENSDVLISSNELKAKEYILQYKSQFSREGIKNGLKNTGISDDELENYLNKYF